jgi:hypothetical protein
MQARLRLPRPTLGVAGVHEIHQWRGVAEIEVPSTG